MILLYVFLLLALALTQWAVRWRVARLERRYARLAAEADTLAREGGYRGGNCNKADPCASARQQYQLAQVVLRRDRVEQRYARWQSGSERFARFRGRLAGFQGKVVPYFVGAVDVAGVVVLLHTLGVALTDLTALVGR